MNKITLFMSRIRHTAKTWYLTHPRKRLIAFASIILLLGSVVGVAAWNAATPPKPAPKPVKVVKKPQPKVKYYSPLTGREVPDEKATKQAVSAIIIENSPDARPQSGLKDAGVIYEAIAEGGITRFLALYQQEKPQLIGPVRSLRMYYLDWSSSYQSSIVHFGGSAKSLEAAANGSHRDLNLMAIGGGWRDNTRAAPHNVYTSFSKLDALNAEKGYTESVFTSFQRSDKPTTGTPATSQAVNFGNSFYNTQYSYDAASKTYLRSIGGAEHIDREAGRIAPNVLIAIHVDMTTVMEDGYRQSINTVGTGKAEVFQNGEVIEGTWRKNSLTDPLELIDATGQPITLTRGQTWIAAIPNTTGSVTWQ